MPGTRCNGGAARWGRVTGVLAVPVGEALGQVTGAEALQVHRQERGVVQPVDPAQPVVKLQAVEDPGAASRQKMSSASRSPCPSTTRPARIRASNKGTRPARNRPASRCTSSTHDTPGRLSCRGRIWSMLSFTCATAHPAALLADRGVARGRRMLGGEDPCDLADRGADGLARLDQGRKPPGGRQPAHHHQVIADPASRVAHLHDTQIHIGGEPPVELDLALARRRACLRRTEVQESRLTGFFSLKARSPAKYTTAECVSDTPPYGSRPGCASLRPSPSHRHHPVPTFRTGPGPRQGRTSRSAGTPSIRAACRASQPAR